MHMKMFFMIVVTACFFNTQMAQATTRDEMVSFVKEAVKYAKNEGKEKALKEFTNRKGKFVRGELYLYACDYSGLVLAQGGRPALVGKNIIDMQDRNGKFVMKELTEKARKGSGFVEYLWDNPEKGTYERKLGYVEKVDNDWYLGSGIYLGPVDPKDLKK